MDLTDDRWLIADQLFDRALDMELEERKAYLERACHGDTELRRLVEKLLSDAETQASHLTPGGGLEGQLWNGLAVELDEETRDPVRRVGRYDIVQELGRGGMAEVYLGEARDGAEPRIAALKIIRHAAHTEELVQRFERERRILDRIRHHNIARFYGGGMTEDNRPYLAMEYVEGRTIERYCDEEKLPIAERLRLFLQVTQAVDLAHSHHVIHRDIKPSNILVTTGGTVKLLDFGIARLLEESEVSSVAVPLTMSHSRLMTPAYASPELIQSARVDVASDIYQLGLLLYLLLTGRWPYPVFKRPPGDVVHRVCRQEPLTPSDAVIDPDAPRPPEGGTETPEDLATLRATTPARLHLTLSGRLDGIVLGALAKKPEDRFRSVAGLMGAIEGFVGPEASTSDGA